MNTDTRIRNDNINLTHFLHDLPNAFRNRFRTLSRHLERLRLDSEFLGEGSGEFIALGSIISEGQISSCFSEGPRDIDSESSTGSGDAVECNVACGQGRGRESEGEGGNQ